jgi:hypothetical protein
LEIIFKHEFDTELIDAGGGGVFVYIPFDVYEIYGTHGQVKIKATIDGYLYRGSIVNMGKENHLLGIRKDIRQAINKGIGDIVHITLEKDTEPRIVEIPDYFKEALEPFPELKLVFDKFSYSHKNEYIDWLISAKKPETRQRRIKQAIEKLIKQIDK